MPEQRNESSAAQGRFADDCPECGEYECVCRDPAEQEYAAQRCEIDTCGENRDDGQPWPASATATRDGEQIFVCSCHADGWDD